MPIQQTTAQRLRKDIKTYLYREEDCQSLDKIFHYQQTQPYYQWREEETVLGASVAVTNTAAFEENRSFKKRIKGKLVLPEGLEFAAPVQMTIFFGSQQLVWARETLELKANEEDPNALFFDLPNQRGEPVPLIHFQDLRYSFAHRTPGLSIELEVSFDEEGFEDGFPNSHIKLITTTLLYQRSLGADDSGQGLAPLLGQAGMVNVCSGNHYLQVPLFSSIGKGISTELSLHYNHWNTAYDIAIDNLLFYNDDSPDSNGLRERFFGLNALGYGWNHSYDMRILPYALPEELPEGISAKAYVEVTTGDGNRIQFIESDKKGVFEPQYLSDAWDGDANLLLSMRVHQLENGWMASGSDLTEYRFNEKGQLVEISTIITRKSGGALAPLKIQHPEFTSITGGVTTITDTVGRVTTVAPDFSKVVISNAAKQVFTLTADSKSRRVRLTQEGRFSRTPSLSSPLVLSKIEFPEKYTRSFRYDSSFGTCFMISSQVNAASRVNIDHLHPRKSASFRGFLPENFLDFWGFVGKVNYGSRSSSLKYDARNRNRQRVVYHQPHPTEGSLTSETHFGYHPPSLAVREITNSYPVLQADGSRLSKETLVAGIEYYRDRNRNEVTRLPNITLRPDGLSSNFNYRRSKRFPGSFLLTSKAVQVSKTGETHTTRFRYHPGEELHRLIDTNNNVTLFLYTSERQVRRVTHPRLKNEQGRAFETWDYRPDGQPIFHRDTRGFVTNYNYGGTAQYNGNSVKLDPFNLGLSTGKTVVDLDLTSHQAYTLLGLVEKSFDPLYGGWTETEFDELSRPKKTLGPALRASAPELPLRHEATQVYNDNGTLKESSDNFGNKTSYTYTSLLELETTSDVFNNKSTIVARNLRGQPIQVKDAKGHTSTFEYDDYQGRPTKTISPTPVNRDGKQVITTMVYDDAQSRQAVTTDNLSVIKNYDGLDRLIGQVEVTQGSKSQRQVIRTYKYPNSGFTIQEKISEIEVRKAPVVRQKSERTLDEWGREISHSYGLNGRIATTQTRYDFASNVVEILPPLPEELIPLEEKPPRPRQRYVYDALNRKTASIDAYNVVSGFRRYVDAKTEGGQAAVEEYSHGSERPNQPRVTKAFSALQFPTVAREVHLLNAVGQVERVFDFFSIDLVQKQSTNRISRGQPRLSSIPYESLENPVAQKVYDARGQVRTSIDAEGVTRTFEYNVKGLKTAEHLVTEAFNAPGRVFSALKNHSTSNKVFKEPGTFHEQTQELLHTVSFTYDANDNLLTTTEPSGKVYSKTYDELNRLFTDSHPEGGSLPPRTILYDERSRPVKLLHQFALTIGIDYKDLLNEQVTVIERPDLKNTPSGGAIIDESFEWDGQLRRRQDTRNPIRCKYDYDELRNLKEETYFTDSGKRVTQMFFDTDLAGNRSRLQLKTSNGDVNLGLSYFYDSNFQLTSIKHIGLELNKGGLSSLLDFTYSKSGLPQSIYRSNGVHTEYHFDEIGRPHQITDFQSKFFPIGGDAIQIPASVDSFPIAEQFYRYQPATIGRKLEHSQIYHREIFVLPNEKVPHHGKVTHQFYQYRKDGRLKTLVKSIEATLFFPPTPPGALPGNVPESSTNRLNLGLETLLNKRGEFSTIISDKYREFVFDKAGREIFQVDGTFNRKGSQIQLEIEGISATDYLDEENRRDFFRFLPAPKQEFIDGVVPVPLPKIEPLMSIEGASGGKFTEIDHRANRQERVENLVNENGRVWQRHIRNLVAGLNEPPEEMAYSPYGELAAEVKINGGKREARQFRIYDGNTLIAILSQDFQLVEFFVSEPGSNVRLATARGGALEFLHTDIQYQPIMITNQAVRESLVSKTKLELSGLDHLYQSTLDFTVGWADAFTAGWTTNIRKWFSKDYPTYNKGAYNAGWWIGLGSSIATGVAGGGAASRAVAAGRSLTWGTKGIAAYTIAMDVDAVAKSSYALGSGNFHWTDTLGFLPGLGWRSQYKKHVRKTGFGGSRLTMSDTIKIPDSSGKVGITNYRPYENLNNAQKANFDKMAINKLKEVYDEITKHFKIENNRWVKHVRRGDTKFSIAVRKFDDREVPLGEIIRSNLKRKILLRDSESFFSVNGYHFKYLHNHFDDVTFWIHPRLFEGNSKAVLTRLRFVIAHEIGHLLQIRKTTFFSDIPYMAETRADNFAKKYLEKTMPDYDVDALDDLMAAGAPTHYQELSERVLLRKTAAIFLLSAGGISAGIMGIGSD